MRLFALLLFSACFARTLLQANSFADLCPEQRYSDAKTDRGEAALRTPTLAIEKLDCLKHDRKVSKTPGNFNNARIQFSWMN